MKTIEDYTTALKKAIFDIYPIRWDSWNEIKSFGWSPIAPQPEITNCNRKLNNNLRKYPAEN